MMSKLIRRTLPLALVLALACAARAESAREAPDFSAPDLSGSIHTLSSHRGKVVILNFWATWCPECVKELPSLSAFAEANKDVVVLGIASERDPETVRKFLSSAPVAYPVLLDASGDIFVRKYLIRALPTTVIVDRNGMIADRLYGAEDFQSARFREKIRKLMQTP